MLGAPGINQQSAGLSQTISQMVCTIYQNLLFKIINGLTPTPTQKKKNMKETCLKKMAFRDRQHYQMYFSREIGVAILIKVPQDLIPLGPEDNEATLVQVMNGYLIGDKLQCEQMKKKIADFYIHVSMHLTHLSLNKMAEIL